MTVCCLRLFGLCKGDAKAVRFPPPLQDEHDTMTAVTILPKSLWWLGEGICDGQQRFLLGREALSFMGFPVGKMDSAILLRYGESFLHDLAGNAYCGMWLGAFMLAVLFKLKWHPPLHLRQACQARVRVHILVHRRCPRA